MRTVRLLSVSQHALCTGGVCLPGVCLPRLVSTRGVSQHAMGQGADTSPPVDMTDTCERHNLRKLRLRAVTDHLLANTVADLGFSPGGAPTPKVGVLIYYFCRKLHENERIWTPGRGARHLAPPPWIRQCNRCLGLGGLGFGGSQK